MPTLEQLNREAARTRESLLGATGISSVDGSTTLRGTLGGQPLVNFGASVALNQAGGAFIAPHTFDRSLNVTKGPGVGQSGTVTRFGIDPRLAARGSFQNALRGGGGGGGTRTGGATGSVNVQQSRTDIQPQLEAVLSSILAAGGTPQAQAASSERASATQALNQTVQDLSVANNTALAQGVVQDVIRQTLDEVLPQLQASGEGAGASRSALDQLQLNDIAARTAERAATATVEAITGLGNVQASAGQVVDRLTASDPISDELIKLITGTPTERTSSQGSVDILNALGLLPNNLDPATLDQLLASNAPQFASA